eukprot:TRINITY_DN80569_c0_g1_i1.p1 TRINITY_DN80569_c0_g1~~TRINITY_DN80569_c0_g1_i1.p1  ORF type:complete len:349 (+),score=55.01 TRINITY_DN80569_c0_g1_i1:105-1049(+)
MAPVAESFGLCFVAELGDMSFFTTLLLAAWCPIYRSREKNPSSHLSRLYLVLGSVGALLLRTVLRNMHMKLEALIGYGIGPLISAMLLALLAFRAYIQLRYLETESVSEKTRLTTTEGTTAGPNPGGTYMGSFTPYDPKSYDRDTEGATEEGEAEEQLGNSSIFRVPPPPPLPGAATSYGTSSSAPATASASTSSSTDFSAITAQGLSLLLPLVIIFLAEAGSDGIEIQVLDLLAPKSYISGMLGCTLAAFVAVCVGYVLERQVKDATLIFATSCGLAALSLFCLRTAALRVLGPTLNVSLVQPLAQKLAAAFL